MDLSTDDVRDIALLARIAISDGEVERMRDQLSSILDHFEVLSEIDTDDVPPTAQSFNLTNVERPDVAGDTIDREGALDGAPRSQNGYFRVRAVLD
jgi:aspartyl-tRNA(Asn)/glutamyl-tRNA(Gln) amidotransferase subunit C